MKYLYHIQHIRWQLLQSNHLMIIPRTNIFHKKSIKFRSGGLLVISENRWSDRTSFFTWAIVIWKTSSNLAIWAHFNYLGVCSIFCLNNLRIFNMFKDAHGILTGEIGDRISLLQLLLFKNIQKSSPKWWVHFNHFWVYQLRIVLQSGHIFAEDLNVINKKHKWNCS